MVFGSSDDGLAWHLGRTPKPQSRGEAAIQIPASTAASALRLNTSEACDLSPENDRPVAEFAAILIPVCQCEVGEAAGRVCDQRPLSGRLLPLPQRRLIE